MQCLRWWLENSEQVGDADLGAHRRTAQRLGLKVKSLEARPAPPVHLLQEWSGFAALSRRRPVGFSVGAIPLAELRAWMDEMGLHDPEQREDFLTVVEAMDAEFMRIQNDKAKAKAK